MARRHPCPQQSRLDETLRLLRWAFRRHGLLRDLLRFADRVNGKVHAPCEFLGGRLAPEFLDKLTAGAGLLVDRFDHVDGHADGARLVGDGAGDALANPPSRVSGEFVTAAPFEFVCALHEADIALLDQIEELHAAIGIFLGNGDDETKVCFGEFGFGLLRFRLAKPNGRKRAPQRVQTNFARFLDVPSFRPARTQLFACPVRAFGAGRICAAFESGNLAFERMQPLGRDAQRINQPPLLGVAEFNRAD